MRIDIVVCTKDRPENLLKCIPLFAKQIPHNTLYVYEGSLKPNWEILNKLKDEYNIKVVLVPYLKFGHVRNITMQQSNAKYVAMVDDDITIDDSWFTNLMVELKDPSVVAVSSKLIFGDGIIRKMCEGNTRRISGGSGGAAIYDRKEILKIGNFNKNIHRGEDMELELRIHHAKKKWVKSLYVKAYHPATVKEFLDRPKDNVCGWDFIMRYSRNRRRFMAIRFASTFTMPFYYFWKTLDLRVLGVWFIYKMKCLLYYLSGKYIR